MNAKVKYCEFLCLILCALLVAGCARRNGPEDGEYRLYYIDAKDARVVREYRDVEGDSTEQKIDNMLEMLKEGPEEIEGESAFMEEITVDKWKLAGEKLKLYFNEEYEELDTVPELYLRAAVVQSLTQLDEVEYVAFYVGDQPLVDDRNMEIGYMRGEDFVQNVGSSLHSYQIAELTLYFANAAGDKLVPEEVSVRYNSNTSMEKLIVEQLLKGPRKQKSQSTIPKEAKVLGVSVKDRVCYVNFDEGFLTMAGNPQLTIYSLVNSIIDSSQVDQVQILVNGETNIVYQEQVDLSKPLTRDKEIIEVAEE